MVGEHVKLLQRGVRAKQAAFAKKLDGKTHVGEKRTPFTGLERGWLDQVPFVAVELRVCAVA